MRIGFFDSGIGGLTVLYEALRILPHEDYLYYADSTHVPYGNKPKDLVRRYVGEAAKFLVAKGIQALVVSCNTATSVAINELRNHCQIPIIGMEPAIKPAVKDHRDKRVLVFATEMTLKEEKFQKLVSHVDDQRIIDYLPLQELVMHAENFVFDPEIIIPYLEKKLASYDMSCYGTIVLGCTHFPYYKRTFRKIIPRHIKIIDGNLGTVRHLKRQIEALASRRTGKGMIEFYISGQRADDELFIRYLQQYAEFEKEMPAQSQ